MSNLCDLGHKYEQSLREHIKRRCAGVSDPQPRLLEKIRDEVYTQLAPNLINEYGSRQKLESAIESVLGRWIDDNLIYDAGGFVEFTKSGFYELTRG